MEYRKIYIELYSKKYNDVNKLLTDISINTSHQFWDICRDCAEEILIKDKIWEGVAHRIDDFAILVHEYMCENLAGWLWKAQLGVGALSNHLESVSTAIKWVICRWISMLKNLFDTRYKFHIDSSYIVEYKEALHG